MTQITLDDEYSYPLHQTGSISTLPIDPPDDTLDRFYAVIKEITGVDMPRVEKPRMGFLP